MSVRTAAKSFDDKGRHIGPGPWLSVIWAVNEIIPGTFSTPDSTGPWWAGGYVEEYPTARVIHNTDETVYVAGKTQAVQDAIAQAAKDLGL